jgi:hypothetical protein
MMAATAAAAVAAAAATLAAAAMATAIDVGGCDDGTTVTCDPECAADGMSTAAQEMKGGLSWELAASVGGSATVTPVTVAATTKAAAIKPQTMAANAPADPQTLH